MRFPSFGLRALLPSLIPLLGCSGSGDNAATNSPAGFDAGTDGSQDSSLDSPSDQSVDSIISPDSEPSCQSGEVCGDGGVCTGSTCCATNLACGDICCQSAQVCSFGKCENPGVECHDSSDCSQTEYCEYSIGKNDGGVPDSGSPDSGTCTGGVVSLVGKCLPRPPICASTGDAGANDAGVLNCLEKCQFVPPTTDFQAKLTYSWGGDIASPYTSDIMMMPIVIQLDDDDCDGKVTANDIPEIVFSTFAGGAYTQIGTLHAISIVGNKVVEKWTTPGLVQAAGELASGNIDGKPGNEVVACGGGSTVVAFKGDGSLLWKSEPKFGCRIPAVADLDGDGVPEVIVEGGIIDGATGKTKATFTPAMIGSFVVSDIDNDGKLDIVSSSQAYHSNGVQFIDTGKVGNWPAIGDFDKDGVPEVVGISHATHTTWLWHFDGAQTGNFKMVRDTVDINGALDANLCPAGSAGNKGGGGPPTVADFNADGYPDLALAGGVGYAILDGKKLMNPALTGPNTFLWVKQTHDCSSAATGSSIFDFNGDGSAEVVYSDEFYLRIYDGKTGAVLWETCNTTGTLIEYPVIADVNNDGQADIVVASNAYAYTCAKDGSKQSGIRVFTSAGGSWVRTRRIWNQHSYHVTNILEDGTIPQNELPNWKQPGLNNFRQNKQPGSEFAAPDAIVTVQVPCGAKELIATVRNVGEAALPPNLEVTFYEGDSKTGKKLGTGHTVKSLYSAQAEQVILAVSNPSAQLANGTATVSVVVAVPADVHECRPANNESAPAKAVCSGPK